MKITVITQFLHGFGIKDVLALQNQKGEILFFYYLNVYIRLLILFFKSLIKLAKEKRGFDALFGGKFKLSI